MLGFEECEKTDSPKTEHASDMMNFRRKKDDARGQERLKMRKGSRRLSAIDVQCCRLYRCG